MGLRGTAIRCPNGHFHYSETSTPDACPICGDPGGKRSSLLFPRHGFATARSEPVRRGYNAKRVGVADVQTIAFHGSGGGELDGGVETFGGIDGLKAYYRESGVLFVVGRGKVGLGFAICTKCGFADSESSVVSGLARGQALPEGFEGHPALDDKNPLAHCWRDAEVHVLRNLELAARETTDIVMIDLSGRLRASPDAEAIAWTLSHAFRIAGARSLDVETRELGGMPVLLRDGWGVAIYDDVPGGAGHVQELLADHQGWMSETLRAMYIDDAHHLRCEKACLDCLLTYDAQRAMERLQLQRKLTYDFLIGLRGGAASAGGPGPAPSVPAPDERDRLAKAAARRARRGEPV